MGAGWEIRDTLCWLYGSGFPKSLSISKAIDAQLGQIGQAGYEHKTNGAWSKGWKNVSPKEYDDPLPATDAAKEWAGYGSALKPSFEPILVCMKPLEKNFAHNAVKWGVAGLNVDGSRIDWKSEADKGDPDRFKTAWSGSGSNQGWQREAHKDYVTVPVGSQGGRWPANLLLDQHAARLLDEMSGESKSTGGRIGQKGGIGSSGIYGKFSDVHQKGDPGYGDVGGASRYFTVLPDETRFFYCAKSSTAERSEGLDGINPAQRDASRNAEQPSMNGGEGNPYNRGAAQVRNSHPCIKPLSLMRWLCRLTKSPKGGVVLDPFMGSATTGIAALLEGRSFVGVEKESEYFAIAEQRMEHWQDEAEMTPIRVRGATSDYDSMPLFAEVSE